MMTLPFFPCLARINFNIQTEFIFMKTVINEVTFKSLIYHKLWLLLQVSYFFSLSAQGNILLIKFFVISSDCQEMDEIQDVSMNRLYRFN